MLVNMVKEISGKDFRIHKISSMEDFNASIKKQRVEYPAGENELYAKWQQGQYMYSMFSTQHSKLSNERYKSVSWTTYYEYLQSFVQ